MTEIVQTLSSGADAVTIVIGICLLRQDRRILVLEEWRKVASAKLAALT